MSVFISILTTTFILKKTKLHTLRLEIQITQDVMANMLGMSQATYSRKERGLTSITSREWDAIALILNVDKFEVFENNTKESITSGNQKRINAAITNSLLEQIEILKKENLILKEKLNSKFPAHSKNK